MSSSINVVGVIPDNVIMPLSIVKAQDGERFKNAPQILYYGNNGQFLIGVSLRKNVMSFYVPPLNQLTGMQGHEYIKSKRTVIENEMAIMGIREDEWRLWDMTTEKFLTRSSLSTYVPKFHIKGAVFALADEQGAITSPMYYIQDVSSWGLLQFAMLSLGKQNLIRPFNKELWTSSGKKLASYIMSKRYIIPYTFDGDHGPWDSIAIRYDDKVEFLGKEREFKNLPVKKALELASGMVFPDFSKKKKDDISEKAFWHLMDEIPRVLSYLAEMGISGYEGENLIDIEIDMCHDIFSKVQVDPLDNTVMVKVTKGCNISIEEIASMLCVNPAQVELDKNPSY